MLVSPEECKLMKSDIWYLTEYFLHTLKIIDIGNSSKEFAEKIIAELQFNCDNETTIEKLKMLSIK